MKNVKSKVNCSVVNEKLPVLPLFSSGQVAFVFIGVGLCVGYPSVREACRPLGKGFDLLERDIRQYGVDIRPSPT